MAFGTLTIKPLGGGGRTSRLWEANLSWFLTASEVERVAARPATRPLGLMALVLALVASGSAASAEPLDKGVIFSVSRIDLTVRGAITPRCQLNGGGDIDFGELTANRSVEAPFALDCNVPFDIGVQSMRGGLAHETMPQGQGPFAGILPYDVRLSFPILRPSPSIVEASFNSSEATGRRFVSSGDGISGGAGKIALRTHAPAGAGLLAGRYAETLMLTVTPRM